MPPRSIHVAAAATHPSPYIELSIGHSVVHPITPSNSNMCSRATTFSSLEPTTSTECESASSSAPPSPRLKLPRFHRVERAIDHHCHDMCCDHFSLYRDSHNLRVESGVFFGTREHMEDRHVVCYGAPSCYFRLVAAVMDGHGGDEAAHFVQQTIIPTIMQQLAMHSQNQLNQQSSPLTIDTQSHDSDEFQSAEGCATFFRNHTFPSPPTFPTHILSNAFLSLESRLLQRAISLGCTDGTTLCCVVVTASSIICANTGDSRAVLFHNGQHTLLSHDHKPSRDDERHRIEHAGGSVHASSSRRRFCCWSRTISGGVERLWPGGYSVSRTLGDIDYKDARRKKTKFTKALIPDPDIITHPLSGDEELIVIGSDGLWDVLSPSDVYTFVKQALYVRKPQLDVVAQHLAEFAYKAGSEDNITATVIFFRPFVDNLLKQYQTSKQKP